MDELNLEKELEQFNTADELDEFDTPAEQEQKVEFVNDERFANLFNVSWDLEPPKDKSKK